MSDETSTIDVEEESKVLASEKIKFKEVPRLHKEGSCDRCWKSGVDEELICCYRVDARIKELRLTDDFQAWLKTSKNMGRNECYMMIWAILRGYSHNLAFTKHMLKRFFEPKSQTDQHMQTHEEIADKPLSLPAGCAGTVKFLAKHKHMGSFLLYPFLKTEEEKMTLKYKLDLCQNTEDEKIGELLKKENRLPGLAHWGLPKAVDEGQCKNYGDTMKNNAEQSGAITGVGETQATSSQVGVGNVFET